MVLGIIVSLIIFSIVVLFHEYGHFKAARIFGVKVLEFGLGIPPKIGQIFKDKKGTSFTLNLLPIGGFVRLKGENYQKIYIYKESGEIFKDEEHDDIIRGGKEIYDGSGKRIGGIEKEAITEYLRQTKEDDNLVNISYIKHSIVLLAGIFMNFLLAFLIFWYLFFTGIKPVGINDKIPTNLDIKLFPTYEQSINYGILIKKPGVFMFPLTGSVSEISGIKEGDLLISVDGVKVSEAEEVKKIINYGKTNKFTIIRKNEILVIQITPKNGLIGSYLSPNIEYNKDFKFKFGPIESAFMAGKETFNQSILTFQGIVALGKKIINPDKKEEREEAIQSISGPIGIVGVISSAIGGGISIILILSAVISINLGIFNLLPLGALDGGRWLFLTLNEITKKITGKKQISPIVEGFIHTSFFVILIILSIIVAYNDIMKI